MRCAMHHQLHTSVLHCQAETATVLPAACPHGVCWLGHADPHARIKHHQGPATTEHAVHAVTRQRAFMTGIACSNPPKGIHDR